MTLSEALIAATLNAGKKLYFLFDVFLFINDVYRNDVNINGVYLLFLLLTMESCRIRKTKFSWIPRSRKMGWSYYFECT